MTERDSGPYGPCISRPASECEQCALADRLKCRFRVGDLLFFLGLCLTVALPAGIGMVLGGFGWYLLGWPVVLFILLGLWENRVLCSHCPYYAEKGSTLRCFANYGLPKLWRYRPGPAGRWEKAQFVVIVVLIVGYPFPFLVIGGQYIFVVLALWALAMVGWTMQRVNCSQCVNFSCVFNRVPEEVIDEFLKRNPVMREAWEGSGWPKAEGSQ